MLDEIDYFLNDINFYFLSKKSEELFKQKEKHIFVGISPFNKYYSKNTIILLAKWCKQYSQKITFFYVGSLAEYTAKILFPDYNEVKIQEKSKQQGRVIKNRVLEALSLIGYTKEESELAYRTFDDIKDNALFIENLKEIFSIYESKDNKLKNLIKNFIDNTAMKVTKENIGFFYTYILNELAIFKSVNNIFNAESLIVYHDVISFNNLNIIQETFNHNINYMCVEIHDKRKYYDYFIDDEINIFILNENFKYKFINKSMINNLNISEKETIDKTFFEIFGIKNEQIENNDIKVIKEGLSVQTEETIYINKKLKYFKVKKKPIYNKSGEKIIGLIGSSTDITEIKELQIEAEKQRVKEKEFREKTIHEINNKVQVLITASKILLKNNLDNNIYLSLVKSMIQNTEHLQNIIINHNQYEELKENNKINLQKELIDIVNFIEDEIYIYKQNYQNIDSRNEIIIKSNVNKVFLNVDKTRISQVLSNLLGNAIKHSNSSKINVEINLDECFLVLVIADNGCGIKKEIKLENLFIVDKNNTALRKTNGFGLPICKGIIDAHNGTINFENADLGTKIKISLPLEG